MRNTKVTEKHFSTETIDCRATGRGASTTVVEEANARIIKQNESESENHWEELIIFFSEDAYVIVEDISNTGKHRCFKLTATGERTPHSCGECAV